MTVRMTQMVVGGLGRLEEGSEYDLPETVEASYVDAGIAVFVMSAPVVESAEAAPAPETAAKRTRKPRKKRAK